MGTSKRAYIPPAGFPATLDRPAAAGGGLVAVVVPAAAAELTPDERLSLDALERTLPWAHRFLVVPDRVEPRFAGPGLRVLRVPDVCMADIAAYNRMMLSAWFYRLFAGYEYILIHQLDCLVFRDELADWCARGWSYVGAPWYGRRPSDGPVAVGNGGLSLRRTAHMIAALEADRIRPWPVSAQQRRHFGRAKHLRQFAGMLAGAALARDGRPLAARIVDRFRRPEDEFWAYHAPFLLPGFRLPPPGEALAFAIESHPQEGCARLGGRLPFGCHAWPRFGRAFWLDHIAAAAPRLSLP